MWYFNSTRIYVQKLAGGGKQIIARLQPLEGPTVHQIFGYEKEIYKLKAYIVGEADLAALKGLKETGTAYTLSGYGVNYGTFYVSNFNWDKMPAVIQTITDTCTDPMFEIDMELYKT